MRSSWVIQGSSKSRDWSPERQKRRHREKAEGLGQRTGGHLQPQELAEAGKDHPSSPAPWGSNGREALEEDSQLPDWESTRSCSREHPVCGNLLGAAQESHPGQWLCPHHGDPQAREPLASFSGGGSGEQGPILQQE